MAKGKKCPKCGTINKPREKVCWWCEDGGIKDIEAMDYGGKPRTQAEQSSLSSGQEAPLVNSPKVSKGHIEKSWFTVGLFAIAAAIIFAAWWPDHSRERQRERYVEECLEEITRLDNDMGSRTSDFRARDMCLRSYQETH